ncbi:isoleucine--tRNA ligase, cytoplasmic-like [Dendronephthya gigantea]|uniref:isoleucine--tRNA ligase, cytoplasmic-like n=1 Tax=Dendronephthya gigantea TaxID=151771 RepID=UPI00106C938D|nr:isoleucine--tRNA ligase, cytoplasmic-like [Dendronephthya gigantea]
MILRSFSNYKSSVLQLTRSLSSLTKNLIATKHLRSDDMAEQHHFPKEEEKILELWSKLDAFKSCLKQSEGKPRYTFYDGPPFATGLPHYGHILAGTIKDIVTRYAHQSGYHVERRFGWDCHGLPVEYEIDKKLGINGPDDVLKMGIDNYNKECRSIVMRYSGEWEKIVSRLGRWIDFENDYKTMYPTFMESVWWVFKQLYDKGLVYRGFKVMPYSTKCTTPLSNFEANQNYKDVVDPAVIINFPLDDDPEVSMIAWTTTPWTLPSNLALVVHPDLTYVKIRDNETSKVYIMMEARITALFKKPEDFTILERFPGKTLKDKTYKPIFSYFEKLKKDGAFRVLCDTFVTEDSGTGVVHSAPGFGEDDFRVSLAHGVIKKGDKVPCPVDNQGQFTEEVTDFNGIHVKEADKKITKLLKERGRLVHQSTITHSYPFCWRSDTPLIYKAVPGWFVKVESFVDKLLVNNKISYWVPEFVQEKRFHNWLENAHDWNISRNRYWGTPIPLWVSDDYEEVVCVGSIDELEQLSGVRATDLHRENTDKITIPSKTGRGTLKRISEVFDCWFESGSMPYAQEHYPFENKEGFENCFPADFIAEGIDQTRGWFYTLLVISTALFNKPPFKNLIVNGLVLAADGSKMSKRKKNYPDPMEVINKYGSDALRLYLINSPVVRADTLKFQEKGVKDIIKDVFLPWLNAYRFLLQNIQQYEKDNEVKFMYDESKMTVLSNIMDRWILSFVQSLVVFFEREMSAYHLYTVVPRLVTFIDQLTNWYVRSNRKRLKGEFGKEDSYMAMQTLFNVIYTMNRMMAPFTPFLTEYMFQRMKDYIQFEKSEEYTDSVHYLMIPKQRKDLIHEDIENAVSHMQSVIELGRVVRDRKTLPIKYPLPEVIVIHQDSQYLEDVKSLENYILEELNVKKLTVSSERDKYGIHLKAEPDNQTLGRRLKGAFKQVSQAIKELTDSQLKEYIKNGKIDILGHVLSGTDLKLIYTFDKNSSMSSQYEAHSDNDVLILLDVTPDQTMLDEGVAREVVNRIQKLRKKAGLQPTDDITVAYDVETIKDNEKASYLQSVVQNYRDYIADATKQPISSSDSCLNLSLIIQEVMELKECRLKLWIYRGHETSANSGPSPFCNFVNVKLGSGVKPGTGVTGSMGTILLENPKGDYLLTYDEFVKQVKVVFGLYGGNVRLSHDVEGKDELRSVTPSQLAGSTVYVFTKSQ